MYNLAERKVLPEIADLKGRELNAEVAVNVIVSKTGTVTKARSFKGDSSLFKRSEQAALKWHYKPYLMAAEPVEVDTTLEFRFTKDKVEIVVPPPPRPHLYSKYEVPRYMCAGFGVYVARVCAAHVG